MDCLESRTRDLYVTGLWFVLLGGTQSLRCWIHGDGALGAVGGLREGPESDYFMFSTHTIFLQQNFTLSVINNVYLLKRQVVRIVTWIFGKTINMSNRLTWLSWLMDQAMHLVTGQEIKGARLWIETHMKPQEWINLVKFPSVKDPLTYFDFCQNLLLPSLWCPACWRRSEFDNPLLGTLGASVEVWYCPAPHKWKTGF